MLTPPTVLIIAAITIITLQAMSFADAASPTPAGQLKRNANRIRPCSENPRYWQYKGKAVMLLGGSKDDNLFQIPDLEQHLDLLQSIGGNYIRNTMSDRPDHDYEIKAFGKLHNGLYDLDKWNDEYWQRFENMLKLTAQRDIIVQIEIWDRFDHSREPWKSDPFNPDNNINYDSEESQLAGDYPEHPYLNKQPFFFTPPTMRDIPIVLSYQQRFVDKMLSYSLQYDHVLYCMDNETQADPEWGIYWNKHIKAKAAAAGVGIETTEMWDNWDLRHKMHRATLDHPELYSFADLSQNSQTPYQANWDNAQWVRKYITSHQRPMNETKIYGADTCDWKDRGIDASHAKQTFWRNILGGFASSRFHRPDHGLGLSETAQTQISSVRMLLAELDIFHCEPDADLSLLSRRQENEAYLTCKGNSEFAVYFTNGGEVDLDLSKAEGDYILKWLNIEAKTWLNESHVSGGKSITLSAPDKGQWTALLKRSK